MSPRDPASDAFAEFLERRERGEDVEPQAFARAHPGLEAELTRRFATLARVERTLGGERAAAAAPSADGARGDATRLKGERLGPYRLLALIGVGSMGGVYRARVEREADGLLKRQVVAIKVFHPALLGREQLLARFQREAQVGLAVNHVNLVRALALGTAEVQGQPVPYLVMEHVEGEDLAERIAHHGALSERLCRRIARAVARGLAALAAHGVVHRDLKPQNVMLGADGSIKVMDFGLVRLLDAAARLTQSGTFVGSVVYAAPEQLERLGAAVDARADLYALGLLLYEAAVGARPWPDESLAEALRRRRRQPAPSPAAVRTDLTPFFDAVVTTLLQPAREDRFADAETLLAVLEEGESSAWWRARRASPAPPAPPAAGAPSAPRSAAPGPAAAVEGAVARPAPLAAACLGTWRWRDREGGEVRGRTSFRPGPSEAALVEDSRWTTGDAAPWEVHGVWTFAPERRGVSAWWFETGEPDPTYLFGSLADDRAEVRGHAVSGRRQLALGAEEGRLRLRLEREGRPPLDLVGEREGAPEPSDTNR